VLIVDSGHCAQWAMVRCPLRSISDDPPVGSKESFCWSASFPFHASLRGPIYAGRADPHLGVEILAIMLARVRVCGWVRVSGLDTNF
jgi:hypothetical protein